MDHGGLIRLLRRIRNSHFDLKLKRFKETNYDVCIFILLRQFLLVKRVC